MEWQNFLNLCICQESQLRHVEDYRRVGLGAGPGRGARAGWAATRASRGTEVPEDPTGHDPS